MLYLKWERLEDTDNKYIVIVQFNDAGKLVQTMYGYFTCLVAGLVLAETDLLFESNAAL